MSTAYGHGTYGTGPYGGVGLEPVATPIIEPVRRAAPVHILGIGPWANGIVWTAANYGYHPTVLRPAVPHLPLPDDTGQRSVTLRRTGASEAQITLRQPRGTALVITEMVTDLWWRRHSPGGITEALGRFNAASVDISADQQDITVNATFTDYRGVLEDRIIFTDQAWTQPTPIVDILDWILPDNAGVDYTALTTTALGTTTGAHEIRAGTSVGDAIKALSDAAPTAFDWSVDIEAANGARPRLLLWPETRRGPNHGVVLVDDGSAYSPIAGWQRRGVSGDYANSLFLAGKFGGAHMILPTTDIPEGQRDAYESDTALTTREAVETAARRRLAARSQRQGSWTITLAPGWWQGRHHIDLGDEIRVVVHLGQETLDELHLVEEIALTVDANNVETVTLTLGRPLPARNPRSRYSAIGRLVRHVKNGAR